MYRAQPMNWSWICSRDGNWDRFAHGGGVGLVGRGSRGVGLLLIGPEVDGSALATPPFTPAELEPWYHRVSVSLIPVVETPHERANEPAVRRSLHPWYPWAALCFCLLLIGFGSESD